MYGRMPRFFPKLVKEVVLLDHPPWMQYVYVRSFAELDTLLRQECGDDWKDQPWAKEWLRSYWREQKEIPRLAQKQTRSKQRYWYPKEIIQALVQQYDAQGLSVRAIISVLRDKHRIRISPRTVLRYMRKNE
jgi:hypothetical protein